MSRQHACIYGAPEIHGHVRVTSGFLGPETVETGCRGFWRDDVETVVVRDSDKSRASRVAIDTRDRAAGWGAPILRA
jgi:hypothetical protein